MIDILNLLNLFAPLLPIVVIVAIVLFFYWQSEKEHKRAIKSFAYLKLIADSHATTKEKVKLVEAMT